MKKQVLKVSRFAERDMEIIRRFLEKNFPDGCVEAHRVVELARPKTSPIHRFFNWDIQAAAEKYWLHQARRLIRCVIVEIDDVSTRKYVSPVIVENYERKQYMEIERARSSQDIWKQVLLRAMKDASLWKLRYEHLKELTLISKSIVEVERKLTRKGVLSEEAR